MISKKKYIYYTDADSIYISNKLFNKLDAAGYVGGVLCQGKQHLLHNVCLVLSE